MIRSCRAAVLLICLVGCDMGPFDISNPSRPNLEESQPSTVASDPAGGRLGARPGDPTQPPAQPGLHQLGFGTGRDGLLYVPAAYRPDIPAPLVVLLHGAGGDARGGIDILLGLADEAGTLLLAPDSRDRTWDVIVSRFGPDVSFLDRALTSVFERYRVDPRRIAVGGFSDGASYALSIGLTNGDLFGHVLAFSPGFTAPGDLVGEPKIYISHGTDDRVLPISRTSRRIVPMLEREGYDVLYEEFSGGHVVPPGLVRRHDMTPGKLLVEDVVAFALQHGHDAAAGAADGKNPVVGSVRDV
ncbi:MAG TPA: alpha/beta hydrolase-fold protein, partial [Actinomycetota bacterium]|nr:alpha/beta hydrolase-fold protein [Actinomycetota bacterium]